MANRHEKRDGETRRVLNRFVRRERGRLIAGLVSRLGGNNVELAEDVAQEAMLKALGVWPFEGIPEAPGAWLLRVARNCAIDRLRREQRELLYDESIHGRWAPPETPTDPDRSSDPEVQLMLLCCHDELDQTHQLILTLRVVNGFTAREIGDLFLSSESAVAQRLSRAKRKLRQLGPTLATPLTNEVVRARLETVLRVVYLMFSLGYAPRRGGELIRRDVADEALRLARDLANNDATTSPAAHALAALLCFQASRFDARTAADGAPVLLRDQDPEKWDRRLIDDGLCFMRTSMAGELTRYHVEAGIASCYAVAPSWDKIDWQAVLTYYDQLLELTDSPVVAINRSVAEAFSGAPGQALARLDSLAANAAVDRYAPYHIARAEILRLQRRRAESRASYRTAIECGTSAPVMRHLENRLASNL